MSAILRNKKLIIIIVLAGIVAAVAWYFLRPAGTPPGLAYGNGRLEATETAVATKVQGKLIEVYFREGADLKTGQIAAQLDDAQLKADIRAAEAAVEQAKEYAKVAREDVKSAQSQQQLASVTLRRTQELIKKGFTPMITPCLAKERTLYGTGYLPFFADQTYKLEREDLALIGTSEQTLVGYHADETLEAEKLPICYTAYSPCFRTEAGSYGKASRGIFRVHQFHKVEQIIFCKPEDSVNQHLFALENEEMLLQKLGLPYHVVDVCVGDMGAPGYRKYDIEAWFPGFNGYREVTSNTNLTEFQSRRLNIRYKGKDGSKGYVHTISATAATDRVAICILENYQQADGSVIIPEVLRPYTGFDRIEAPAK